MHLLKCFQKYSRKKWQGVNEKGASVEAPFSQKTILLLLQLEADRNGVPNVNRLTALLTGFPLG